MNKRKESAYLKQEVTGWFMFEYTARWVARDSYGNWITSGRTRRECEQNCRCMNYTPRR